jgi:hypothetical protein
LLPPFDEARATPAANDTVVDHFAVFGLTLPMMVNIRMPPMTPNGAMK